MSRLIDILTMGDSVKAYHEMQEENKPTNYVARDNANYVWVLCLLYTSDAADD